MRPKKRNDLERQKSGRWVQGVEYSPYRRSKRNVRFSTDHIPAESLNGPVIVVQKGKNNGR